MGRNSVSSERCGCSIDASILLKLTGKGAGGFGASVLYSLRQGASRWRTLRPRSRVNEALFRVSPLDRIGQTGSWRRVSLGSIRYVEVLLTTLLGILRHGSGVPGTCGSFAAAGSLL